MGSETEEFGPADIDGARAPECAPMACDITTGDRFTVILSTVAGEEHTIAVTKSTPFRDVQEQVCRYFNEALAGDQGWPRARISHLRRVYA